jgi:hypothetical protein
MDPTNGAETRIRLHGSIFLTLMMLFSFIVTAGVGTCSFAVPPTASAFVPLFQVGSYQNDTIIHANNNNTVLNTYENPGFGITIQYPSTWSGTQLREDPFAPTNTSIVAIFEAPVENQSDSYRENLILGVQGPIPGDITVEEYTDNSLNEFRNMSERVRILESSSSILAGLPAHEIIYTSSLQGMNLTKSQVFTIVNNNIAYVVSFGAEESQFNKYLPTMKKMIDSLRIDQQATG